MCASRGHLAQPRQTHSFVVRPANLAHLKGFSLQSALPGRAEGEVWPCCVPAGWQGSKRRARGRERAAFGVVTVMLPYSQQTDPGSDGVNHGILLKVAARSDLLDRAHHMVEASPRHTQFATAAATLCNFVVTERSGHMSHVGQVAAGVRGRLASVCWSRRSSCDESNAKSWKDLG